MIGPTIQFSSLAGQTLILNQVTADATGSDSTSPAITVYLYARSVASTSISGTWDAAGQNSARGTFTLTRQ